MRTPGKAALWVFIVIMISVVILQAGRYGILKDNGMKNYAPSGTAAFFELLKRSGYQCKVQNNLSPKMSSKVIIPVSQRNRQQFVRFLRTIETQTTIIALMIPTSEATNSSPNKITNLETGKEIGQLDPIQISSVFSSGELIEGSTSVDLLETEGSLLAVADITTKGKLQVIQLTDASCIVNQHLDKANNASVVMGLIGMAAKPGEEVTYVDSFAARDVDGSLLAKMGAPSQAAWNQLLILVLVIFITLSIRFGLSPESRARQRGARELVDGLASMTRRKKNARWALRAVFDRVLAELERRHRISREQIIQRPDLYLNPESAQKLKYAEAATMNDITEEEAIAQAKELKRLV